MRLRPRILDLEPGTRIVSNTWDFDDWAADATEVLDPCPGFCTALLWIVPARLADLIAPTAPGRDPFCQQALKGGRRFFRTSPCRRFRSAGSRSPFGHTRTARVSSLTATVSRRVRGGKLSREIAYPAGQPRKFSAALRWPSASSLGGEASAYGISRFSLRDAGKVRPTIEARGDHSVARAREGHDATFIHRDARDLSGVGPADLARFRYGYVHQENLAEVNRFLLAMADATVPGGSPMPGVCDPGGRFRSLPTDIPCVYGP